MRQGDSSSYLDFLRSRERPIRGGERKYEPGQETRDHSGNTPHSEDLVLTQTAFLVLAGRCPGPPLKADKQREGRGMQLRVFAASSAVVLGLAIAAPAFAFDCSVAKKPPTAGAVGIIDFTTGEFTPLKSNIGTDEHPHGGFIAFTDGTNTVSTFLHAPGGVLPPARGGGSQHNCDGKGIDSLEVCFGE
jgi:hypothetical protein